MLIDAVQDNSDVYDVGSGSAELGKDQFMKMLVAQMQNQDPTEPMDNSQLSAQLAQFSSLEQMENLNDKFEGFQQSTTAAMSLMNSGSEVQLELADGSTVSGLLDKVQWSGGESQFVVNGTSYSSSDVKSLTAFAAETPSEEVNQQTAESA